MSRDVHASELPQIGPGLGVMHGDRLALALAISPLALSLPALSGGAFASLAVVPALISVQAVLMLFDRRSLEPPRGAPPAALPSPALYLVPGAYLADRARALGRSDDLVWTWVCAMLHSIAVLALSAALYNGTPNAVLTAADCSRQGRVIGQDARGGSPAGAADGDIRVRPDSTDQVEGFRARRTSPSGMRPRETPGQACRGAALAGSGLPRRAFRPRLPAARPRDGSGLAMPTVLPLWDHKVMRVLAFARNDIADGPRPNAPIQAVARVDVVTSPALGCRVGRLMSARCEPGEGRRSRPFSGQRLENAIWQPSPPNVLVAACEDTRSAVPEVLRRGLPWIMVLSAWDKLQSAVPSDLLPVCWRHGDGRSLPLDGHDALEHEAWLLALMLNELLHLAPPDELIALSRNPIR